jgi:hypothetical protein
MVCGVDVDPTTSDLFLDVATGGILAINGRNHRLAKWASISAINVLS